MHTQYGFWVRAMRIGIFTAQIGHGKLFPAMELEGPLGATNGTLTLGVRRLLLKVVLPLIPYIEQLKEGSQCG
jgi:hypothetical protein